jgi:hypothetical protein
MNRSTLLNGPCKATTTYPAGSSVSFFHKQNIEIKRLHETFRVGAMGQADEERSADYLHTVSLVPEGRWSAGIIAALFPFLNKLPGNPIFADTDRTLALVGSDGTGNLLTSVAVTKMPNCKFSATESIIGAVEYTGLLGNAMDWDDAGARELLTTGGTFADSGFANSLIPTQPYIGALAGVTGLTSFDTMDGFEVVFNLKLNKCAPNRWGTLQYFYAGLEMAINFVPVGVTEANLFAALAVQGSGIARGKSLRSRTAGTGAFTIVGDDAITYLSVPSASLKQGATRFGLGDNHIRSGEYSLVANFTQTLGVQQALGTFAAS